MAMRSADADTSRAIQPEENPCISDIPSLPASATWVQNRERDPAEVKDPRPAEPYRRPVVGARTELGSYTVAGERRVIVGQRVDGVVRVSDCPEGTGRAYLIERELETKEELNALVTDYLQRAADLQTVPMAFVPVEPRA
jgi:hypothetical protein